MTTLLLFRAYAAARTMEDVIVQARGSRFGIGVNADPLARRYQRKDRTEFLLKCKQLCIRDKTVKEALDL